MRRRIRAKYDSAQTTDHNSKHWGQADGLSPVEATREGVRQTLRNRARYEAANNSYCRGIIDTVANDTIGTGPRLQVTGVGVSAEDASAIEAAFNRWASSINLSEKLRLMRVGRMDSGESFGILANNDAIEGATGVTLDIRLIEPDQVMSSLANFLEKRVIDGVRVNEFGTPIEYHVTKEHPGGARFALEAQIEKFPASQVLHYFKPDRPGQIRGIPDITPALPLFGQLRRFTLATLTAAETAADFASVVYTDAPAGGEADPGEAFDVVELERGMGTVLPDGWKIAQLKPEHPTTTYSEFKREILSEICRCLSVPINVALGDSSRHNYASGRLDHQTYHKAIKVERSQIERVLLSRIFNAWLNEAALVEGLLPQRARLIGPGLSVRWFWDGFEHVDPLKEASAQKLRLEAGTTTFATEYGNQGRDWEVELTQAAKEREFLKKLGLTFGASQAATEPAEVDEEEETADAE